MTDMSILIGVISIAVSIAVGFGTYYLTQRRARANRWQTAKETVLRDLSKCLGEGNVPEPRVITATIRSVLRTHNTTDLEAVTLDEVADDLLRQITSDPFLEADRRTSLQTKVLELKAAHLKEAETRPAAEAASAGPELTLTWSTLGSLLAGMFTSLLVAGVITSLPKMIGVLRDLITDQRLTVIAAIVGTLLAIVAATISMAVTSRARNRDRP